MADRKEAVFVTVGIIAEAQLVDGHLHLEIDTATLTDALMDRCRDGEMQAHDLAVAVFCLETHDWSVRLR